MAEPNEAPIDWNWLGRECEEMRKSMGSLSSSSGGEQQPALASVHDDDDSEDDEMVVAAVSFLSASSRGIGLPPRWHRGSTHGRRVNKRRGFDWGMERIVDDYFAEDCVYSVDDFERRFRVPRQVFERVRSALEGSGVFVRRVDALGVPGIHPLQRIVAAMRMLSTGVGGDVVDEYCRVSETSALISLKEFSKSVVAAFGGEYLRAPTESDLRRIMAINAARGFPGCIGSIDCQHYRWRSCPKAWAGQFQGKEKSPTLVLEAIADAELWFWHVFFGMPGSCNDINVLDSSETLSGIMKGMFPPKIGYKVGSEAMSFPYYLADGIYPNWRIFIKTFKSPQSAEESAFAQAQEAVRKDVERAFGVLVQRFQIVAKPINLWYRDDIAAVVKCCVILHNMTVEARRDSYESGMVHLMQSEEARLSSEGVSQIFRWQSQQALETSGELSDGMWAAQVLSREEEVTCSAAHRELTWKLMKHIWDREGRRS